MCREIYAKLRVLMHYFDHERMLSFCTVMHIHREFWRQPADGEKWSETADDLLTFLSFISLARMHCSSAIIVNFGKVKLLPLITIYNTYCLGNWPFTFPSLDISLIFHLFFSTVPPPISDANSLFWNARVLLHMA